MNKMAFGEDSMTVLKFLNRFAVLKKGERLWKATPSSKQDKGVAQIFFDQDFVVHRDFAPECHTINKAYYLKVLRCLRDAIRRKRAETWSSGNWQINHENAPPHSSQLVQNVLAKHEIPHVR
jgi:hypothetical protein